jgi:hypothetical protein
MRKMMVVALAGMAALAILPANAISAENFIPGGHSYAPDHGGLPPLNSRQDQINLNADIIQSEIYTDNRQLKVEQSELSRFMYNQNLDGPDLYRLDY